MQDTRNTTKTHYEKQFERNYGEFATKFEFGSNPSSELWNGRLAMIGFLALIIIEITTGQGLLHFWGLV
ncbi:MAG TPA: chlorophyll a/b-binding protein [Candidatus Caenarcaniphilales bacterium]